MWSRFKVFSGIAQHMFSVVVVGIPLTRFPMWKEKSVISSCVIVIFFSIYIWGCHQASIFSLSDSKHDAYFYATARFIELLNCVWASFQWWHGTLWAVKFLPVEIKFAWCSIRLHLFVFSMYLIVSCHIFTLFRLL